MNTNQFFSISRFWLLLRNDMMMNYKRYLMNIGGAFVVCFIIIYMTLPTKPNYVDYSARSYASPFLIMLFGLGGFIGMAFPFLNEKRQLSVYLLTPASTFEKYLSQFLIRFIGGIVIFLLIFHIDAIIARQAALAALAKYEHAPTIAKYSFIHLFDVKYSLSSGYRYGQIINEISSLLAVGIFLFSIRVFFNKNGLIKTLLAGTVVFFAILLLFVALSHIFYPETIGMDIHLSYYKVNDTFRNIELWITALACATPIFLLPLGYFKLKEKQL